MAEPLLVAHRGDWTLDDLGELPEDGRRYEIVDGSLLIVSPPVVRHDFAIARVQELLRPVLPPELFVLGPVGLVLGRTVRVPDVVVVDRAVARSPARALRAADVLLAVEVQSPGTATTDRVTKPAEYAAAGIGHYWRLDPDGGPLLSVHALAGTVYRLVGQWRGEEEVVLAAPWAVRVRPADLLR